jgi:hypothetical protein
MRTETPWEWYKRVRSEAYLIGFSRGYWTSKVEDVIAMIVGVFAWMVWNDWDHLLRGAARVWAWVMG